ncbi:MAG: hypothetical protein ACREOE_17475 [Gemmatimonadales bacterium]
MKTLFVAALLLAASSVAANAETFTFTSDNTVSNQVVAPVAGGDKPVAAAFFSGSSHVVYSSGRAATNAFRCANWSAAPGGVFDADAACTFEEPGGDSASIVAGCSFTNKDRTESDCWGAMDGLGGAWKGKTGTISWHAKNSADGTSGAANGTGQWN